MVWKGCCSGSRSCSKRDDLDYESRKGVIHSRELEFRLGRDVSDGRYVELLAT